MSEPSGSRVVPAAKGSRNLTGGRRPVALHLELSERSTRRLPPAGQPSACEETIRPIVASHGNRPEPPCGRDTGSLVRCGALLLMEFKHRTENWGDGCAKYAEPNVELLAFAIFNGGTEVIERSNSGRVVWKEAIVLDDGLHLVQSGTGERLPHHRGNGSVRVIPHPPVQAKK